jgi:hypothetical protein
MVRFPDNLLVSEADSHIAKIVGKTNGKPTIMHPHLTRVRSWRGKGNVGTEISVFVRIRTMSLYGWKMIGMSGNCRENSYAHPIQ